MIMTITPRGEIKYLNSSGCTILYTNHMTSRDLVSLQDSFVIKYRSILQNLKLLEMGFLFSVRAE